MEKFKLPGRIKVLTRLDVKFGEVTFEIENTPVKSKCLYDALSQFGIELEKAKDIVANVALNINDSRYFHLDVSDYVIYGKSQRLILEENEKTDTKRTAKRRKGEAVSKA